MATKKKAKQSSSHTSSPRRSVALTKDDWLDVMDHDGVWNVARVLSVPSPEEVEVMYDGWPEEYDEVVRVDSDRVAPYHTFTWAVKCWVKYLNWPMWPSVITIRTPGTAAGIENLAMENRLYVDFLEEPNFARRDRCWQKKQDVKKFDDNYDEKRTGTNGAQFERALACVLLSDATTKLPRFAKGTLPVQYEHSVTESVGRMRKNMGNRLWYRNFANAKERHIHTHRYETNDKDNDDSASDEAVPVVKLKVRRPKEAAASGDPEATSVKPKKKRSLPAKKKQNDVKIEPQSYAEIVPYELQPMESSESEKEAALKKKRRLQVKTRAAASPVASNKRPPSLQDTNVAPAMPRHVTVMMDEIIVDDDEDSDRSEAACPKDSSTARKAAAARVKRESGSGGGFLSLSDTTEGVGAAMYQPICNFRTKAKKDSHMPQRVRRVKSTGVGNLHTEAWNEIFSEKAESASQRATRNGSRFEQSEDESDGNDYSDGFDPGTTSEDKATSPFGSHLGSQRPTTISLSKVRARSAGREKLTTTNNVASSASPSATKKIGYGKGQTKMVARRSIPPLREDLSLVASPKPRPIRSTISDDDDWEDEEKGFPSAVAKDVTRVEVKPKQIDTSRRSKQLEKRKQRLAGPVGVGHSQMSPRQPRPSRQSKTPLLLIDQRIAFAQEALRSLEKTKQRETKIIAAKDRQTTSSLLLSGTRGGSRQIAPITVSRHQRDDSDLSFLQRGRSSVLDDNETSQGQFRKDSSELSLNSDELGHSFLSVGAAYSSDSQESKGAPQPFEDNVLTPFDEPVSTLDFRSESKKSKNVNKANAKSLSELKISGDSDSKQLAEDKPNDDSGEEKSHEVRRTFCVMRAGLEDALKVNGDGRVRISQKTVISIPRKFDTTTLGGVITSSKDSMMRINPQLGDPSKSVAITSPPAADFSSSEGFSMEEWFKRTLFANYRRTEA